MDGFGSCSFVLLFCGEMEQGVQGTKSDHCGYQRDQAEQTQPFQASGKKNEQTEQRGCQYDADDTIRFSNVFDFFHFNTFFINLLYQLFPSAFLL
jgi:hypothetical protein